MALKIHRRDPGRKFVIQAVAGQAIADAKKRDEKRKLVWQAYGGARERMPKDKDFGPNPRKATVEDLLWDVERARLHDPTWDRQILPVIAKWRPLAFDITGTGDQCRLWAHLPPILGLEVYVLAGPDHFQVRLVAPSFIEVPASWSTGPTDPKWDTMHHFLPARSRDPKIIGACPVTFYAAEIRARLHMQMHGDRGHQHGFETSGPGMLISGRFPGKLRKLAELIKAEGAIWDKPMTHPSPPSNEAGDNTTPEP